MSRIYVLCLFILFSLPSLGKENSDPLNVFIAEDIGLISQSESRVLSAQSISGVHSSTKIQPYRQSSQLDHYKIVLNTTAILSTLKMTELEQSKLNTQIDDLLKTSRKVESGSVDNSDSALYSSISIKRENGSAVLEVLVAIADWADTQKRTGEGPINALTKSTVWSHISRRKLDQAIVDGTFPPSFNSIEADVRSMYQDAIKNLLLTY